MVYPVEWEFSFFFEYLLPGIHHQVDEPVVSLDFGSHDFVSGESLVDYMEPPSFDFVFLMLFLLNHSLTS